MSSTRSVAERALVLAVAALFAAPGVFVVWRAIRLGDSASDALRELADPARRSALLALAVCATCAVLGTGLAWLVTSTDLRGRRIWHALLVTPIALPSFVGTTAILMGLGVGGVLRDAVGLIGWEPPRRIRGFVPAWIVVSAFSYPFVLLPVAARLQARRQVLDESARLLGAGPWRTFARVTLPQVRSAIVGGTLVVGLYTLSEFGAVQLLGYDTLTRVIYATRQADRARSFMAAAILLVSSLVLVTLVRRSAGDRPDERASTRSPRLARLGALQLPAQLLCLVPVLVATIGPVAALGRAAYDGLRDGRADLESLLTPARNTTTVALLAALTAVVVVYPVARAAVHRRDGASAVASVAIIAGFALPAVVIALSLAVITLNTVAVRSLYQTTPLLIAAYVVHFGSQALASVEQGVRAVSVSVADSARLLERAGWRRFLRIELPMLRPGLTSGAALVLLATIKELPATLLLAPIGFRTLSTEVWASFEEGFLGQAAVASLVLLAVSATLTFVLLRRGVGDAHD